MPCFRSGRMSDPVALKQITVSYIALASSVINGTHRYSPLSLFGQVLVCICMYMCICICMYMWIFSHFFAAVTVIAVTAASLSS